MGLAAKPGLLRTVAGAPLSLVKGLARGPEEAPDTPTSGADGSLANQWVDFLISQAQAADAAEGGEREQDASGADASSNPKGSATSH